MMKRLKNENLNPLFFLVFDAFFPLTKRALSKMTDGGAMFDRFIPAPSGDGGAPKNFIVVPSQDEYHVGLNNMLRRMMCDGITISVLIAIAASVLDIKDLTKILKMPMIVDEKRQLLIATLTRALNNVDVGLATDIKIQRLINAMSYLHDDATVPGAHPVSHKDDINKLKAAVVANATRINTLVKILVSLSPDWDIEGVICDGMIPNKELCYIAQIVRALNADVTEATPENIKRVRDALSYLPCE